MVWRAVPKKATIEKNAKEYVFCNDTYISKAVPPAHKEAGHRKTGQKKVELQDWKPAQMPVSHMTYA